MSGKKSSKHGALDTWITQNPKQADEIGYYERVSKLFNVTSEVVRHRWRALNGSSQLVSNSTQPQDLKSTGMVFTYNQDGGTVNFTTEKSIESLEDLVAVGKIDVEKYQIVDFEVKSYNAWIKNEKNEIETKQLFSVKAHLKVKKLDNDLTKQKDLLLDEIKKSRANSTVEDEITLKNFVFIDQNQLNVKRDCALEINIPDLHIGKLAWGKETGEDYDIKIAVDRYKKAVKELISRVNVFTLEKIILPVGNDMINVDNAGNTTTAGTNVSCDSRFGKMFQTAKFLLIETIDMLRALAPVEVIVIPGNHDSISMFTLGEVLDAWYNDDQGVTVTNTHTPRKYTQYGKNLIMYTHGHREKLNDLGIICATEQPQLWAATKFRRVHVGHFHHSKQVKFVDVQEFPGFTVKILNSLSANDAWHAEKGYNSLKGAEAFLYHKDKGLLANYYYLNQ